MRNKRFIISFVYLFAIQCVVAYPFPEFHFAYNMSHNSIELQTKYIGFQIQAIKYDNSVNYNRITDYLSNRINHILIHGLEPCTKYKIGAVVHNSQSNVEFIHSENITTSHTEIPIKIQNVQPVSNSIYIFLDAQRIDCVLNLYVLLNNDLQVIYTKDNITKQLIIPGVEPCTHYHTQIILKLYPNLSRYKIYEQYIKSDLDGLRSPENLNFDTKTNLLTWGPTLPGSCIGKYLITVSRPYIKNYQRPIFTGESLTNKYDFGFLTKCMHYQVSIHPDGRNDLNRTIQIQTPYKEPGSITNISVDTTNVDKLSIKWNRPEKYPDCIKYYAIKVNGEAQATTTNAFKVIVFNRYDISNISVCLITQLSTEKCSSRNFSFSQMQTIEIRNVSTFNVFSNTITNHTYIIWNEPKILASAIRHYVVTLVDDIKLLSHQYRCNTNRLEIPILPFCVAYTLHIKIVPIINKSLSIESTFKFETKPDKPYPPEALHLISKSTNSLTLNSSYSNSLNDKCRIEMFRISCDRDSEHRFLDTESGYGIMTNLKSRTYYNCSVTVKNEVEWSEPSIVKQFLTGGGSSHFNLYAHLVSSHTIGVSYSSRSQPINLTITKVINRDLIMGCKYIEYNYGVTLQARRKKYKFKNLEPYTNYSIQAVAYGTEEANDIIVTTHADVPHRVRNLRIINSTSKSVTVSWNVPCSLNGRVKGFIIKMHEPNSESFLPFDGPVVPKSFYYTINHVPTLGRCTNISVGIKLFNLVGPLNESTIALNTPITEWLNDWVEITRIDSAQFLLNIRNETFMLADGIVTGFTLVISVRECHNLETDDVFSLLLAKHDCIQQCHFSGVRNSIKITLSEGRSNLCANPNEIELKRGPDYSILARIFTVQGYTDTFPIVFKSRQILQNGSSFIMIFLILLVCLVFIVMSVTAIVWFYKNHNGQIDRHMNATYIAVEFFPDFYKLIDQSFIVNEYKSINAMDLSNLSTIIAHNYPEKNRFPDILPYDYNRVILTPNKYCTTDYINASHIAGEKQPDEYIATQGPKEETVYDFWHMVIDKNCDKIVMLTQLTENYVDKCYMYYPNQDETLEFNDITVTNTDETKFKTFIRRGLTVERNTSKRFVYQYQFLAWPDFECPRNELGVIEFIEYAKNEKSKSINPMVVHCSAGVGRTGTFIALDILLQSFRNDKYINIFDTVRRLRLQRYRMVQTVSQYEFLYTLVNVYFHRRIYK